MAVIAAAYLGAQDICARALDELCARDVISTKELHAFFDSFPARKGQYVFRSDTETEEA